MNEADCNSIIKERMMSQDSKLPTFGLHEKHEDTAVLGPCLHLLPSFSFPALAHPPRPCSLQSGSGICYTRRGMKIASLNYLRAQQWSKMYTTIYSFFGAFIFNFVFIYFSMNRPYFFWAVLGLLKKSCERSGVPMSPPGSSNLPSY